MKFNLLCNSFRMTIILFGLTVNFFKKFQIHNLKLITKTEQFSITNTTLSEKFCEI